MDIDGRTVFIYIYNPCYLSEIFSGGVTYQNNLTEIIFNFMRGPYTSGIGQTMQKKTWAGNYFTGVRPHENKYLTRGQVPNSYFEIIFDGSIDSNSGQLDRCIACTFEGLDCRGGFENQTHQAASSSRLVHEPLRFLSFPGIWLHHLVHLAFHCALSWKCSQICILPFYFFHLSFQQEAFHWALSWKCSQPCILPFYFFHLLFSKKHVFMFGCHSFCHVLSIFWAGWVVVSAAFFVSRGSEQVEYPENSF